MIFSLQLYITVRVPIKKMLACNIFNLLAKLLSHYLYTCLMAKRSTHEWAERKGEKMVTHMNTWFRHSHHHHQFYYSRKYVSLLFQIKCLLTCIVCVDRRFPNKFKLSPTVRLNNLQLWCWYILKYKTAILQLWDAGKLCVFVWIHFLSAYWWHSPDKPYHLI